LTYIELKRAFF